MKNFCDGKLPNCISAHFNLEELTKTNTGVFNTPKDPKVISNLRRAAENILEPVRKHFNRRVIIHSAYRSPAVNRAVGGSNNSQHSKGEAVDFRVEGHTVHEVANLPSRYFACTTAKGREMKACLISTLTTTLAICACSVDTTETQTSFVYENFVGEGRPEYVAIGNQIELRVAPPTRTRPFPTTR